MPIGDVVEWRGTKYVQTGENAKDQSSWKPVSQVSSVPSKPFTPGGHEDPTLSRENIAKAMIKATPLAGVQQAGDFLDKMAYEGGGKVTDAASILGASPETAAKAGVLGNMATQAAPSILGGFLMKAATSPGLKDAARWSMQSAMKPPKEALLSGDASKAVETMLKEGVNVTPGGMQKLATEVRGLSGQVDDLINAAQQSGSTVSKVSLVKAAREEIKRLGQSLGSQDDVAAAEKVLNRILSDPKIKGLDEIPVRAAQDIKTATYRALGEKAYNQADKLGTAELNVTKGAIRGMKEGLERSVPGVQAPNQRMSELLNAIEVANPRALGAGNMNFGGLSYLSENLPAAGGMLLDRSSLFKSILGRGLYTPSRSIMFGAGQAGTGAYMQ